MINKANASDTKAPFLDLHFLSQTGLFHPIFMISAMTLIFNDILHMSFLAGTHVFKAFPAYTTTEI